MRRSIMFVCILPRLQIKMISLDRGRHYKRYHYYCVFFFLSFFLDRFGRCYIRRPTSSNIRSTSLEQNGYHETTMLRALELCTRQGVSRCRGNKPR